MCVLWHGTAVRPYQVLLASTSLGMGEARGAGGFASQACRQQEQVQHLALPRASSEDRRELCQQLPPVRQGRARWQVRGRDRTRWQFGSAVQGEVSCCAPGRHQDFACLVRAARGVVELFRLELPQYPLLGPRRSLIDLEAATVREVVSRDALSGPATGQRSL